ncbi:MAG: BrnA antitoxin family protein [Nitrospinae bacterium]|nr:BrnA antitoxin family protein [Nitrospinota bacterium]
MKEKHIKSYTAAELKARRSASGTDYKKLDSLSDEDVERYVAGDEDEHGIAPDWTQAKLVLPERRQSVHLRLEKEIIIFFKKRGKGHISRMQAVLKAYVDAHRPHAKR